MLNFLVTLTLLSFSVLGIMFFMENVPFFNPKRETSRSLVIRGFYRSNKLKFYILSCLLTVTLIISLVGIVYSFGIFLNLLGLNILLIGLIVFIELQVMFMYRNQLVSYVSN